MSNALIDKNGIYLSSKDQLTCMDFDGTVKWISPLNKKIVSKSIIFSNDSLLYMINRGFAFLNGTQTECGKPFFAGFNKKTGSQKFLSLFSTDKLQIKDFTIFNDTVLVYSKNSTAAFSLATGTIIADQTYNTALGDLDGFVGNQVYIKSDSTYKSLVATYISKHYLTTLTNKVLELNNRLEITKTIDFDQLYICYYTTKDYKFLAKGDQTIVIDSNCKIVADFKSTSNSVLIGTKMYDVYEKSVFEVDLSELLGK